MRRGDIWTVAGGGDYTSKPRPAVIVQDDRFAGLESVTICPLTSELSDSDLIRVSLSPDATNGLDEQSQVMVDKITTIRSSRLRQLIGRLSDDELVGLDRAMTTFLGMAGPQPTASQQLSPTP